MRHTDASREDTVISWEEGLGVGGWGVERTGVRYNLNKNKCFFKKNLCDLRPLLRVLVPAGVDWSQNGIAITNPHPISMGAEQDMPHRACLVLPMHAWYTAHVG